MKTNMMTAVLKWSLIFSVFLINTAQAQVLERVFTNEFEISDDAILKIQGPKNFNMQGEGKMSIGPDGSTFAANDTKPVLKIDQDFHIKTWDDKKVKQVVEVKLLTTDRSKGQELLEKLNVKLKESPSGNVDIDCGLNIKRFKIVNGFFRKDRSTLELDDGSEYDIDMLEIKAHVTVPKTNKLMLNLVFMNTIIDEHNHEIVGEITSGSLKAKKLNFLNVKFNFATIEIDEIKELRAMSQQGNFDIGTVEKMSCQSSFSKYNIKEVGTLLINNSATDKFNIRKVNHLKSFGSTFTDYQIDELEDFLDIQAGSGDIRITKVNNGFKRIALSNHFSTIHLGLSSNENYMISNHYNNFTSYSYPDGLKTTSNNNEKFKENFLMGSKDKAGVIEIKCESCKVFFK